MIALALPQSQTPASEKDHWRTPPALFQRLDHAYGPFDLDAAADATNHLCPRWLGPGSAIGADALDPGLLWCARIIGRSRAFCNPPYSRGMVARFLAKAQQQAREGICQTTFLLLAATGDGWFHNYLYDTERHRTRRGVELEFIKGRVVYLRPDGSRAGTPPFGSLVATIYGG